MRYVAIDHFDNTTVVESDDFGEVYDAVRKYEYECTEYGYGAMHIPNVDIYDIASEADRILLKSKCSERSSTHMAIKSIEASRKLIESGLKDMDAAIAELKEDYDYVIDKQRELLNRCATLLTAAKIHINSLQGTPWYFAEEVEALVKEINS